MQSVLRSKEKGPTPGKLCLGVYMEQKQSIMHYQPSKSRQFLRIVLATPNLVSRTRGGRSVGLDQVRWTGLLLPT